VGAIIDLKKGEPVSFDRLIEALGDHAVIFVGEVHDNPEHHLLETQLLQALMGRFGPLTVGMEFLERQQQSSVDAYVQGNLTEEEFRKDVDWKKTWGYDYRLYRPLFLGARNGSARVLALNAPRNVVQKVARTGLSSLSADERDQIAGKIELDNPSHRAMVREVYEMDVHKNLQRFEYFYEAQCVWEDTMAETIARHLAENGQQVVVFSGRGHIVYGFGIPDRVARRSNAHPVTVVLYPVAGSAAVPRELADYVWLTGNCSVPRSKGIPLGHGSPSRP
jgi:uncharacterized iron-regulated protein